MSIRNRVEDAEFLWRDGRMEGAFLMALVAVAATSKSNFPNLGDRQAFEKFLCQGVFERIKVEFRGDIQPVYHVFYKWFRCELIHEGGLPIDIHFIPDSEPGMLMIRAGGSPEYILQVSYNWFHELVHVVKSAPVNKDAFC